MQLIESTNLTVFAVSLPQWLQNHIAMFIISMTCSRIQPKRLAQSQHSSITWLDVIGHIFRGCYVFGVKIKRNSSQFRHTLYRGCWVISPQIMLNSFILSCSCVWILRPHASGKRICVMRVIKAAFCSGACALAWKHLERESSHGGSHQVLVFKSLLHQTSSTFLYQNPPLINATCPWRKADPLQPSW